MDLSGSAYAGGVDADPAFARIEQAALQVVGAVVVALDPEGCIRYFNQGAEAVTGYRQQEVLGRAVWDFLIPPEEAEGVRIAVAELTAGDFPNQHENDWIDRQGRRRRIAFVNTALVGDDGQVTLIIGTGVDVTEAREAQALVEGVLAATTEQALVATDLEGRITVFNAGAERMLGYSAAEVLGRSVVGLLLDPAEVRQRTGWSAGPAGFEALLMTTPDREAVTERWSYRRRGGGTVPVALSVTPLRGPSGPRGYLGVAVDISAQLAREAELHRDADEAAYRAAHDSLTGLANRTLLMDRLGHSLAVRHRFGRSAAVVFLDVDGLKSINDSYGHAAGDALLRAVAERLRHAVRSLDMVARLGGDEFAILLDEVHGPADVDLVIERVERALADPVPLPAGASTVPAASIGVAWVVAADSDPAEVVARADAAMYEQKRRRRQLS